MSLLRASGRDILAKMKFHVVDSSAVMRREFYLPRVLGQKRSVQSLRKPVVDDSGRSVSQGEPRVIFAVILMPWHKDYCLSKRLNGLPGESN